MKSFKILTLLLIAFSFQAIGQKEVKTIEIKVDGICEMCETRIENALDVKGIKMAEWSHSTHICKIVYREDKISEDQIHHLINEAGHDTEKSKASDEAYANVHGCCKYREHEDH